MIAVVDAVLAWIEADHRCVLAMLVDAEGSAPRSGLLHGCQRRRPDCRLAGCGLYR
jgi:hypothetical protein